jgi:hypothetical protein
MIKLYREEISSDADRIEAEFREMILGYECEIITPAEILQRFGVEYSLPTITNNEIIVSGDSIPEYVEELRDLMKGWQAFQGDWCYLNEDGNAC